MGRLVYLVAVNLHFVCLFGRCHTMEFLFSHIVIVFMHGFTLIDLNNAPFISSTFLLIFVSRFFAAVWPI